MRTAYKVWIAIAAVVFCLVAVVDLSSSKPTTTTAASTATPRPVAGAALPTTTTATPPSDPAEGRVYDDAAGVEKKVAKVIDYQTIQFTGGQVARVDGPDLTSESWVKCQEKILNAAARRLLNGKTVTAGHDSSGYSDRKDWIRLRGYEQYTPETDYTSALSTETTTKIMDECYPESTSSGSSGAGDVDIDVSHDGGLPDGALTGGYCRKKWWC